MLASRVEPVQNPLHDFLPQFLSILILRDPTARAGGRRRDVCAESRRPPPRAGGFSDKPAHFHFTARCSFGGMFGGNPNPRRSAKAKTAGGRLCGSYTARLYAWRIMSHETGTGEGLGEGERRENANEQTEQLSIQQAGVLRRLHLPCLPVYTSGCLLTCSQPVHLSSLEVGLIAVGYQPREGRGDVLRFLLL